MSQRKASKTTSRDRLVTAANVVFMERGYHGATIADILDASGVPKGSLYHHFPNGKADIGLAAAQDAGKQMASLIDATFEASQTWQAAIDLFCERLATLFERTDQGSRCPVASILLDGHQPPSSREEANIIYNHWIDVTASNLERLDAPNPRETAEKLLVLLQGSWVIARASGSGDKLRDLPNLVLGKI